MFQPDKLLQNQAGKVGIKVLVEAAASKRDEDVFVFEQQEKKTPYSGSLARTGRTWSNISESFSCSTSTPRSSLTRLSCFVTLSIKTDVSWCKVEGERTSKQQPQSLAGDIKGKKAHAKADQVSNVLLKALQKLANQGTIAGVKLG